MSVIMTKKMTETLHHLYRALRIVGAIVVLACTGKCALGDTSALLTSNTGATATVNAAAGTYLISFPAQQWTFDGKLAGPASKVKISHGKDGLGFWRKISFQWHDGTTILVGGISCYAGKPCVLFSVRTLAAAPASTAVFPELTRLPQVPYHLSYENHNMAPHTFDLAHTSTPWIFFNQNRGTFIVSPASKYMVSLMTGNGKTLIADALNPGIRTVPADFSHRTVLVVGTGIEQTMQHWGHWLNKIDGVVRPGNQADVFLKYFGYWTDHGATYYYNYIKKLGYTGTLRKVCDYFNTHIVPLHYLQLDSWWYPKSDHYYNGGKLQSMNPRLPEESWNVYGGIYLYHAAKTLFPNGLKAFDTSIGNLPLGVHCRWISHRSPYRRRYRITGIAAVDPKYWNHVAAYLSANGVRLFEHDWLNVIYKSSPKMANTLWAGDAFTNNMAAAMAAHGIDMQYCMPTARYFLQGSRYPNLTSIRVSSDHFMPSRWNNDLYTSAYARALGIWPWVDVFDSPQTGNMLLAVLSGGPVGVGDPIGKASRKNVLRAVLPDGLIVKPDAPLVVTDQTILADAAGKHFPLTASTYSNAGVLVRYLFIYRRKGDQSHFTVTVRPLDNSKEIYIYNWFKKMGHLTSAEEPLRGKLKKGGWKYFVESPLLPSGIAVLGDTSLFASMGTERIPAIKSGPHAVGVSLMLCARETSVTLTGYAKSKPRILATKMCHVFSRTYNQATGIFHIKLVRMMAPGIRATQTAANLARFKPPGRQTQKRFHLFVKLSAD